MVRFGAKEAGLIVWKNEWWRLLSSIMLHGGILHIIPNGAIQVINPFFINMMDNFTSFCVCLHFALFPDNNLFFSLFLNVVASGRVFKHDLRNAKMAVYLSDIRHIRGNDEVNYPFALQLTSPPSLYFISDALFVLCFAFSLLVVVSFCQARSGWAAVVPCWACWLPG